MTPEEISEIEARAELSAAPFFVRDRPITRQIIKEDLPKLIAEVRRLQKQALGKHLRPLTVEEEAAEDAWYE
jgi:hypothetical protein